MRRNGFRKLTKVITLISLTCMATSVLAACSSKSEPSATDANKPLELQIMMIQQLAEPPNKDNQIISKIEEHTNTKLNIIWVPGAGTAYDDKVSATNASGTLPDIMLIRRNKESAMLNAQLSGLYWDLEPYLKDTKNLSQMSPIAIKNASVNGKLYGIPRERVLARYGMIFRKDWLDNLGLETPTTVDEIYNVAKAFTLNDPDQDGKHNTYGIQEDATMELLKQLVVYNGMPNGWGLQDGVVTPDFLYPQFKESLDLYKKMYDEKLIMSDFPIAKKYDYFNQEKAGIYFSVIDDAATRHFDMIVQNPKVEVDVAQNFDGPAGQQVRGTFGYDSLIVIPKSSVPTEEKLKQVLNFIDKLGDEEILSMLNQGIEGIDYTIENEKAKKIEGSKGAGDMNNLRWGSQHAGIPIVKSTLDTKIDQMFEDNKDIAIVDLSASLVSDMNTQKGSDLRTAITDAQTKYVLGELDDKGWTDVVNKWRKDGGDKIMEEFTADYNNNK